MFRKCFVKKRFTKTKKCIFLLIFFMVLVASILGFYVGVWAIGLVFGILSILASRLRW